MLLLPGSSDVNFYRNAVSLLAWRCAVAELPDAEPFAQTLYSDVLEHEAERVVAEAMNHDEQVRLTKEAIGDV